mgnify:CR=1 FL=1
MNEIFFWFLTATGIKPSDMFFALLHELLQSGKKSNQKMELLARHEVCLTEGMTVKKMKM